MADDGLKAMEDMAHRLDAEQCAAKAVTRARVRLVLGKDAHSAFFATLALRLKVQPEWRIPTAATDGTVLLYHPDFWNTLSEAEAIGVVSHEVLHNAMSHMSRRHDRNPAKWNIACDASINGLIVDSGLKLPKDCVMPGVGEYKDLPPGLSAEAYYGLLPDDAGQGQGDDPGGCGGVLDAGQGEGKAPGDAAAAAAAERDWKIAVSQAAQAAKQRGTLPGNLDKWITDLLTPVVDWRAVLREFIRSKASADYSWTRPNRRFVGDGQYLPSLYSEELGNGIIHVDTSGSTNEAQPRFASELQGILECYPCKLTVIYGDAEVQRVDTWTPQDGPLTFNYAGGGGTDHRPIFRYIEEHLDELAPAWMISFTDMDSCIPTIGPDFPVLWAKVGKSHSIAPFGQLVEVTL